MNMVILTGNLTKEPEARKTAGGVAVTTLMLAVDRDMSRRDRDDGTKNTDYITVITWRHTAELCNQYLHKGSQIAVQGKWRVREYEKDGQKRTVSECVADEVQFLGPPPHNVEIP